jgi:hypothetical protein
MFELSSLFVSIKARDDQLRKQLATVKDNLVASGKSISSAISDNVGGAVKGMASGLGSAGVALGTAIGGGVLGIVTSVSSTVIDFVKDTVKGSEDLTTAWNDLTSTFGEILSAVSGTSGSVKEQLTAMFAPAIGKAIEFVSGYVRAIQSMVALAKPWIDSAKEGLESIVAQAQPVFDAFQSTVVVVFQNVGVAVQAGVEHFARVKEAVINATGPAIALLQQIPGYVAAAFGSTQVQTIVQWGTAIKEWVVDKIELAGLFIRNWPDFFDIAAIEINQQISNISAIIGTIPENAGIVANYIANNWRQLIVDALSATGKAFMNLGENIGNLAVSIKDFFAGKGWHFDFKPLLDGFKATADKLPELAKPKFQDVSSQAIKEINDKIAAQEANRKPFKLEIAEKKKVAEEVAAKAPDAAFKSQTMGVADLRTKIIEGIFSKDKSDIPKQQLKEQKDTNTHLETIAKNSDKKNTAVLGP